MLECGNWSAFDEGVEQGFQTGRQTSNLETMIWILRAKKIDSTDIFPEYCRIIGVKEEQIREFMRFFEQRPHMPAEKLAERIMMESEYIY